MSEFKHPFKYIKEKNTYSEEENNSNKQLSYDCFCAHVDDLYKDSKEKNNQIKDIERCEIHY